MSLNHSKYNLVEVITETIIENRVRLKIKLGSVSSSIVYCRLFVLFLDASKTATCQKFWCSSGAAQFFS